MLLTKLFQYLAVEIVEQVPEEEYFQSGKLDNIEEEVRFKAGPHTIEAIFNEMYSKSQLDEMTRHLEQSYKLFKAAAEKNADEGQLQKEFFDAVAKPIAGSIDKVTRLVVSKGMASMDIDPLEYKNRYGKTDWQRRKCKSIGLIVVFILMILAGVIVEFVRIILGQTQLPENIIVFVVAALLLLLVALFGKKQATVFAACARKEIMNLMSEEVLTRFNEIGLQESIVGQYSPLKALMLKQQTDEVVGQLDLAINVKGIQSAFRMAPVEIAEDVIGIILTYLYETKVGEAIQLVLSPQDHLPKTLRAPESSDSDDKTEEDEDQEKEHLIQFNTTTKKQINADTGKPQEELTLEMAYTGRNS
ncbi:MAG: hypothetical protein NXI13_06535 [Proteobacteria bacterium]|nr:hypothetical protein [Pseudomonadota bacterium]